MLQQDLEQTLTLLHSEWSKEIEPLRQSSTHHPLIVSNPIDKKGSEFIRRSMQWETPSMRKAAYDPGLLLSKKRHYSVVIGKNWFLDQEIPAGGFVRIQGSSQIWKERVDDTRIIATEGLTTCLDPGRGWTITNGGWNFPRLSANLLSVQGNWAPDLVRNGETQASTRPRLLNLGACDRGIASVPTFVGMYAYI